MDTGPNPQGDTVGDDMSPFLFSGVNNNRPYIIAAVALMAVATIIGLTLTVLILLGVRRRADPARLGTYSIKTGIIFLTLSIITALTTSSIFLYIAENPNNLGASAYRLFKATEHTDLLWELFDFLAQVSIFVTLTSIAVSAQSVTRGGPNGFGRLLRLGTFVVAAVVVALAFAVYGLRVASLESGGTVYNWNLYEHADRAAASASILNWIMSLYNCGLAVLAMGSGTGKGIFFLLAFANFFNIIGTTWNMAYYIRWHLHYNTWPGYIAILHAALQMWTSLVVLLLCYAIFTKKAGGIWTVGRYGRTDRVVKEPHAGRMSY